MAGERNLERLLQVIDPRLDHETYVFCELARLFIIQ
ncbi:MAG: hypothetical protein P8L66_07450 [Rhodospirillaceae bacterium]|nr:hypothetical protein [Rhodospirillaceae bacterium]